MKFTSRSGMVGLAVLIGASLALAPFVLARPPAADGKRGPAAKQRRQARKAQMKAKRGEFLRKDLGLADAKAQQVETTLDGYRKQVKTIKKSQRTLMGKIDALLGQDSNDAQAYEYNLRALAYNKVQIAKIKEARQNYLSKALTPKQQALMITRLGKFNKRMRHMRRGKRGKRGQRGGN